MLPEKGCLGGFLPLQPPGTGPVHAISARKWQKEIPTQPNAMEDPFWEDKILQFFTCILCFVNPICNKFLLSGARAFRIKL